MNHLQVITNAMWAHAVDERPKLLPCSTSFVYFAKAEGTDFVKIGTSVCPDSRLNELRTGCPYPLRMESVILGGRWLEQAIHSVFQEYRFRSEWFTARGRLRGFMTLIPARGVSAWHAVRRLLGHQIRFRDLTGEKA